MRKIIDDKTLFTIFEDIDILTYPILEESYRSCCWGRDEPEIMKLSINMYEYLRDNLFKLHPEFATYKKFHNAKLEIVADISDKEIQFLRISESNHEKPAYKLNCIIKLN